MILLSCVNPVSITVQKDEKIDVLFYLFLSAELQTPNINVQIFFDRRMVCTLKLMTAALMTIIPLLPGR